MNPPDVATDTAAFGEERQKLKNELDIIKTEMSRVQNELKNCKKLLQLEIGSDEDVAKAFNSPGEWKGRAERIAQLEARIMNEKVKLAPALVVDKKRTIELEAHVHELEAKISELTRSKLGLKSRNEVLETTVRQLREDVNLMIEREKTNSRLIDCLKEYLN